MKFEQVLETIYKNDNPVEVKRAVLSLNKSDTREFKRALALWVCHYGFDELVPKRNNMVIPLELEEYREKKRTHPRFSLSPDFWAREDIYTFIEHESTIERENKNNKEWLEEVYSWLTEEDDDFKLMVQGRINEFDGFDKNHRTDTVVKEFGGSVV